MSVGFAFISLICLSILMPRLNGWGTQLGITNDAVSNARNTNHLTASGRPHSVSLAQLSGRS